MILHIGECLTVQLRTGEAEHQKIALTVRGLGRLALGGCACGEIDLESTAFCRCTVPVGAVGAGTLTLTLTVTAGYAEFPDVPAYGITILE